MKKVLIFGSNGLLGQNLLHRFKDIFDVVGASVETENYSLIEDIPYYKADITNRSEIDELLNTQKPDIIINTAAFTDVDGCEKDKEKCWDINVHGVENIIDVSESFMPILVHISTDYVFDGQIGNYRETDEPNPLGNYARSKMAAENMIKSCNMEFIIARTQVLYGYAHKVRLNFATWVISRLKKNQKIRVVSDQIGTPTYIEDLAEGIFKLLEREEYGLYHVSGHEIISRYNFAKKIADVFELDHSLIEKIRTNDLKQESPRPMDSSFILDKLVNHTEWEPGDVLSGLQRLKIKLEENNG